MSETWVDKARDERRQKAVTELNGGMDRDNWVKREYLGERKKLSQIAIEESVSIETLQKWVVANDIEKDPATGWYFLSPEQVELFRARKTKRGRVKGAAWRKA